MIFTVKGPIFFQFLDIFIEVIYFVSLWMLVEQP